MAKKAKVEKELRLEDILFNCRDQLRGKASMADKRDLLLALVFLRFVGEKFTIQREAIYNEQIAKGRDPETDVDFIASKLEYKPAYAKAGVFYLPENCRWENIVSAKADATLPTTLDNIINQLELDNASLKGALPQKIFTTTAIAPKVLKAVIDEVGKISQKRFPERDLIGRVYEYFLQAFAFQVKDSKEEGEFYTPHSIVNLIANIIEPFDGTIYDPCCGSGGMFVQSMKVIEAHGGNTKTVSVYGQEQQPETFRLAKMNLAVRGISHDLGSEPADTFNNDQHKDKKMDYIITNPPFNLKKWRTEDGLLNDPRWAGYEVPPVSNANYAWILHILNKLNVSKGIAGFLLANKALDDSDTVNIRKKLIENDKVEAIIVLPRQMFYTTDISVTLWILNQNKKGGEWHGRKLRNREGEVLFVDLRTWNENVYEKKYVELKKYQIQKVCDIYHTWQTSVPKGGSYKEGEEWISNYCEPELYYAASKEEILEKDGSLVPSRYIEFVDRDTELDFQSALTQMSKGFKALNERWEKNKKTMLEALAPLMQMCQSYIQELKHEYDAVEIGEYIEETNERNSEGIYGASSVRGLTTSKGMIDTKANMEGVSVTSYKIVKPGEIAFVPDTSRRGDKMSLGYNELDESVLVSSISCVIKCINQNKLIPQFLYLWLCRSEFDRYARFNSWGSARETFSFADMCRVKIPLPPIEKQQAIVNIYNCANEAKKIAAEADRMSREACPALIQHVIHN